MYNETMRVQSYEINLSFHFPTFFNAVPLVTPFQRILAKMLLFYSIDTFIGQVHQKYSTCFVYPT